MGQVDYREIYEIYHYGTKHHSGRYPYGSGDRPYQDKEARKFEKRDARKNRLEKKLTKKFDKRDRKISKNQERANKFYEKGVKKENSFFSKQKSIDKAYEKANKAQRLVNKYEYSTKKTYEKYLKKIERMNIGDINPDLKRRGDDYIRRVAENSKGQYQAFLSRRIT